MNAARILVLLAGLAAIAWSSQRWREGVKIALVLAIFEGALRKWVVPSSQDLIYFAKDVFLLGAYAGFLRQRRSLRYRPPALPALSIALGMLAVLGLAEIFNPNLPNLLVGAFGFKAYFFYVPLLYILPAVFPSDAALATDIRRYLRIAVPVGLLALAQFFSPAGSFLNTYAQTSGDQFSAITFGSSSFVRVTATFSFISGYTAYLLAMSILLLAWLGAARWRFRGNLDLLAALGFTLLGMLMTGSRGPLLAFALVLPLYWWLAIVRERQSGATFLRLLAGLGLIAVLLQQFGGQAVGAFQGRAMSSGQEVLGRVTVPFLSPLALVSQVGPFGFGIGAAHQAAPTLAGGLPFPWLRGLAVEAESGRVLIELGPLGFVLLYFVRLFLAGFAFLQVMRLRTPFHRALAISSLLFFLVQIPGTIVFDVTSSLYYWAAGGILLTAMKLDREAAAKAAAAARAAAEPRPETAAPRGA